MFLSNMSRPGPECFGQVKWNYHVEEIVNPIEALKIWLYGLVQFYKYCIRSSMLGLYFTTVILNIFWMILRKLKKEQCIWSTLPNRVTLRCQLLGWSLFFDAVNKSLINVSRKFWLRSTTNCINKNVLL